MKNLKTLMTLAFALGFSLMMAGCGKDDQGPPPQDASNVNPYVNNNAAPRPTPIGNQMTAPPAQQLTVSTWTIDKGLVNLQPGAQVSVPQNAKLVLQLNPTVAYPQDVAFTGPFETDTHGGHVVLKLVQNTPQGVHQVSIKTHGGEFSFPLDIRPPVQVN